MEQEIKFKKQISRRNKPLLIVNDEYIYNFILQNKKSKIDKYQCKEMKTKFNCTAYIKMKEDKIVRNGIHAKW